MVKKRVKYVVTCIIPVNSSLLSHTEKSKMENIANDKIYSEENEFLRIMYLEERF